MCIRGAASPVTESDSLQTATEVFVWYRTSGHISHADAVSFTDGAPSHRQELLLKRSGEMSTVRGNMLGGNEVEACAAFLGQTMLVRIWDGVGALETFPFGAWDLR